MKGLALDSVSALAGSTRLGESLQYKYMRKDESSRIPHLNAQRAELRVFERRRRSVNGGMIAKDS